MTRTIFPPVISAEYADKIAAAVDRGALKIMPHWLSRAACQEFIDSLPWSLRDLYAPTAAVVRDAGEAGREVCPPADPLSSPDHRVDGRLSGELFQIIEGAGGEEWAPVPAIGLACACRPFDERGAAQC
jgi:hypothetical protein